MTRERSAVAPRDAAATLSRCRAVMARCVLLAIAASLLPAVLCRPAAAQAPNPPPTTSKVVSVNFTGSSRFPQDTLARSIGLAPGTIVSRSDIEAAADRLAKLGWFDEVRYKFDSTTRGVEIHFTLHDAPCHPLWFDNFPWFTDAEIESAIRSTGMPYDGTAPESGTGLDASREAIAALLKANNIPGEVEGELVQAPESDGMVERFRVTGPKVTVSSLTFSDALAQNDPRLKQVQDVIVGKPYSRYTLAIFQVEQVRPAYTSKGYLRVRFGEPVAQFIGDPTKPLSKEINVQLRIEPGTQYHWGGVAWSGQLALDEAALNGLLGFAPAEPVDALKLQAGWDAIAREYAKRGYLEAKIDPAANYNDSEGRVSFSAQVLEGIQYRMGQLVLTGLSLTAERQLLAHWKIARGDIFDNSYFEEFLNGGAYKIFKDTPIHFQRIEHLLRTNPQTKTVDVLLNFQ